jgi:hypothetical protein
VILGRERNDVWARPGTPAGLGYPVRGIREGKFLYLHNFAPDRWPCGNVELGLLDTDGSPTKSLVEELGESDRYWQFSFDKLHAELKRQNDPRILGKGDVFDNYPTAKRPASESADKKAKSKTKG